MDFRASSDTPQWHLWAANQVPVLVTSIQARGVPRNLFARIVARWFKLNIEFRWTEFPAEEARNENA